MAADNTECRCARAGTPKCPLCMQHFARGKAVFTAAECGHSYHYSCVQQRWIDGETNCPLCEVEFLEPPIVLLNRQVDPAWYFGDIDRTKCERLLEMDSRPGCFMVRDSKTYRGQYCLSFWHAGYNKAIHSKISVNFRGEYHLTPSRSFKNIDELIHYYSGQGGSEFDGQEWQLSEPCCIRPEELQ